MIFDDLVMITIGIFGIGLLIGGIYLLVAMLKNKKEFDYSVITPLITLIMLALLWAGASFLIVSINCISNDTLFSGITEFLFGIYN